MLRFIGVLALLAGIGRIEAAEDCSLKRVAQFDMVESRLAVPVIEVEFNGRPVRMMIDTGAFWSGVHASLTEGLRKIRPGNFGAVGAGGGVIHELAVVPEFSLGPVKLPNFEFLSFADWPFSDESVAGEIGTNILAKFDLEIDYKGRKVTFYSHDHCPGRVIAWPHGDYAKLPFQRSYGGRVIIPVKLDGHPMSAVIDTGAAESFMEAKTVTELFGLTRESAGVEAAGTAKGADGRTLTLYHHRFETLTLDEMAFPHPLITFQEGRHEGLDVCNGAECGGDDTTDLILGTRHLRLLHLYIAYREHMVYATPSN